MTTPPDEPTSAAPEERWPPCNMRAIRWAAALDNRFERIDHRYHRQFISIVNALEIQFEEGAVPAAVRSLLAALLATAKESLVAPTAFGLDDDVERIYASIAPKRGRARKR